MRPSAAPQAGHVADGSAMKVSVIIPTLNEEEALPELLAALRRAATRETIEIVVADGGSTDGTIAIARRSAVVVVECRRPGRAIQMHQGAVAAKGDILLFLHADTRLPEDWVDALLKTWNRQPRPAAAAFRLRFNGKRVVYRLLETAANWRTGRTGVPQGDQAISVSREAYFSVGGFPPVPLMEEYYLIQKLRRAGAIEILPQAVATSTRRYEKNGPLRNALRNAGLLALHYMGVRPETLARMYR